MNRKPTTIIGVLIFGLSATLLMADRQASAPPVSVHYDSDAAYHADVLQALGYGFLPAGVEVDEGEVYAVTETLMSDGTIVERGDLVPTCASIEHGIILTASDSWIGADPTYVPQDWWIKHVVRTCWVMCRNGYFGCCFIHDGSATCLCVPDSETRPDCQNGGPGSTYCSIDVLPEDNVPEGLNGPAAYVYMQPWLVIAVGDVELPAPDVPVGFPGHAAEDRRLP